jgi:hypothetical protein
MRCGLPVVLVLLGLPTGGAWGRPPPLPPPSGITLHPFTAADGTTIKVPALLHRMFVTGDANAQPGQALARGRAGFAAKKTPSP